MLQCTAPDSVVDFFIFYVEHKSAKSDSIPHTK